MAARATPAPALSPGSGNLDTAESALLAAGVAIVLAALNFAFFWQLMRQNGRLLNEVEALKAGGRGAAATGPEPGDQAPAFVLPVLGGEGISLDGLLAAGRGLAVVVTDLGCGACDPLLPEIGRLQRDPATPVPVVMISRGDLDANFAKAHEHGLGPVLIEEEFEVSRRSASTAPRGRCCSTSRAASWPSRRWGPSESGYCSTRWPPRTPYSPSTKQVRLMAADAGAQEILDLLNQPSSRLYKDAMAFSEASSKSFQREHGVIPHYGVEALADMRVFYREVRQQIAEIETVTRRPRRTH